MERFRGEGPEIKQMKGTRSNMTGGNMFVKLLTPDFQVRYHYLG